MKLKTAFAVLVIGLCPAVSWAAEQDSAQPPQPAAQTQDTGKTTGWQYVNGRATDAERGMQDAQSANGSTSGNVAAAATADDDSAGDQDQLAATESAQQQSAQEESAQDQAMPDQSMRLQGIPEGLEDKLVVILPADWQGSLSDLLAALEETSQDSEILVLKRDTQQEDMSSQDSNDMEDTSDTGSR